MKRRVHLSVMQPDGTFRTMTRYDSNVRLWMLAIDGGLLW